MLFLFVFVCMFARSAIIVYIASLNINFSLECPIKIDFCHVEFVFNFMLLIKTVEF